MSVPMIALAVGGSLGVGALAAPAFGAMLSQPITGEVVPTRIIDLVGYLTASGSTASGSARGLGFEDAGSETSVGSVDNSAVPTTPLIQAPPRGVKAPAGPVSATADSKRMLAVAAFGGSLAASLAAFFLIRRVLR